MGAQIETTPDERLAAATDNLTLALAEFCASADAVRSATRRAGAKGYIVSGATYRALERLMYADAWDVGAEIIGAWQDAQIESAARSIASITGRNVDDLKRDISEWVRYESVETAPSVLLQLLQTEVLAALYAGNSLAFVFAFDVYAELTDEEP